MDKAAALKKSAAKYVAPIDPVVLAVYMLEAFARFGHPPTVTAHQAFFSLEKIDQDN